VDAGVVVQKIVVSRGSVPSSYLGAPTRLPLNTTLEVVTPDRGPTEVPSTGGAGANGAGGSDGVSGSTGSAVGGDGPVSTAGATSGLGGHGVGGASGGSGAIVNPGSSGAAPQAGSGASASQPGNESNGCACSTVANAPRSGAVSLVFGLLAATWSFARRYRRSRA